ncbi:MAG TPA: hypothetical protein VFT45_11425 [Longimicrobium sp.]|nr:hypothetical protein [Longimicrobium sp.]
MIVEEKVSTAMPKCEDDGGTWSDPDAYRAEFQRRLAEKGIFVRLPRTDKEWEPPIPFPVSADEASAMVIRMRRGED